jgi:hypothetical protein
LNRECEQRERLLPEDVRVVGPSILEAVGLRELEELDESAGWRIGQNGDAEAQSHVCLLGRIGERIIPQRSGPAMIER